MRRQIHLAACISSLLATASAQGANESMPSAEEMWRIIQEQQRQIDELKRQLGDTDAKAEAAVEAVEEQEERVAGAAAWAERTQVGGYGELHYNNWDGSGGANDKKEIDFHRFVLYFNHQFNDRIRLFSELELEHSIAGDGQNGEIELEQAYVEFDLTQRHRAKGGLFLIPVGILNETHEPNTFYGVERNPVERNIIPTTWWAGGAGLSGEIAPGWGYDLAVHEGLKTSAADDYAIRDGRQKTSEADANDLAFTGRIKWTGMPGVEIAATVQHQQDVTQGDDPTAGDAELYEVHGIISRGGFGLRALYAYWDLDGSGPRSLGADEQEGWYIEPSYRFNDAFGIFARYNQWDNQAGDDDIESEKKQWNVGMNYWPHPDVVLKADYQDQDNDDDKEQDGFNLGIGYQF
jgi:hypothetical protein